MAEQNMTCSAGMYVLYELAGGSQAGWQGIADDCRVSLDAVKRVAYSNGGWPRKFGEYDYRDRLMGYADEYSTSHAALACVLKTLDGHGARTAEVDAVVAGVGPASSDDEIRTCLERLSGVIYGTARRTPRSERNARKSARSGDVPACDQAVGAQDAGGVQAPANDLPAKKGEAPHAEALREACGPAVPAGGAACPEGAARGPVHADAPAASASAAPAPRGPVTFGALYAALCAGDAAPLALTCADGTALARALLPRDMADDLADAGRLAQAAAGTLPAGVRRGLATCLGADEGLRLREMRTRCRGALADADEAGVHAAAGALAREHAAAAGADAPDALRDPLGFVAARVTDAPEGQLLALSLVALLGGPLSARVLVRASRHAGLLR